MAQPLIDLLPTALQRELDARGLSYQEAARLAHRDYHTIWRLATGQLERTTYGTAFRLLLVLDVRPSALFVLPFTALDESQ